MSSSKKFDRKPPKIPCVKASRAKKGLNRGSPRGVSIIRNDELAGSERRASQRKDKAARDCEMQCSKRRHHVSRSQPVSWSWLIGCKEECT
jgi:hypothetical protein